MFIEGQSYRLATTSNCSAEQRGAAPPGGRSWSIGEEVEGSKVKSVCVVGGAEVRAPQVTVCLRPVDG